MLARDWVIAIILFSLFAGVGSLIVYDITSAENGYNVDNITDGNFDSAYNKVQYAEGITNQMANASTSKEGLGLLGSVELMFGSTITVIQIVFGSLATVNDIFSSFIETFGIPPQLANLVFPAIIAIITTILVFVVVSSLTKTKM
jgi:hypothetical protein